MDHDWIPRVLPRLPRVVVVAVHASSERADRYRARCFPAGASRLVPVQNAYAHVNVASNTITGFTLWRDSSRWRLYPSRAHRYRIAHIIGSRSSIGERCLHKVELLLAKSQILAHGGQLLGLRSHVALLLVEHLAHRFQQGCVQCMGPCRIRVATQNMRGVSQVSTYPFLTSFPCWRNADLLP